MNEQYAVLTALGSDRVGLVDEIADLLEAHSCNIEDSRMSVLGGEFAVIMLISGNRNEIASLKQSAGAAGKTMKLDLQIKETREEQTAGEGLPYVIETVSLDAPGIVHAVTSVLHKLGINIETLESEKKAAPWTGTPMFHMKATIIVPRSASVSVLRDMLEELEHTRDLDIVLKAMTGES